MGNQEFVDFIKEEVKRRENKKEDFMENINKYFIEKEECACEGECEVCKCSGEVRGFKVVRDECRKHPDVEIQLPTRGTSKAMGYDFYSPCDITIKPGQIGKIWTDVKAYMQDDECLIINIRSSMGGKVILTSIQGWIDADYILAKNNGNIGFFLLNISDEDFVIKKGERIGQGAFFNYLVADNGNTDTERTGGFGSTGVK